MSQYPQYPQQPGGQGYPPQGYGQGGYPAQPNYYAPYPPGYPGYARPPQSSGAGTASFVIGLIAGLGLIVLVVIAGVMTVNSRNGRMDERSSEAQILGCTMILGLLANVVGVILGFINIAQKDRKKTLGVLGLIFNGLILLGVLGLMVIGLSMR